MPIVAQRPLPGSAAVVERGLAHELDLDAAVDARDGPHEHVLGVLVGRRSRVRGDRVLAAARAHHERVAHDRPPTRGLPRSHQRVGPRLVGPAAGHVDPERTETERTGPPVEQRPEHARRVKTRDAQPVDRAVGRHERARMTVGEECVVGDRGERRRRRGALGHRRAPFGRCGRLVVVARLGRFPIVLDRCRAHDATHG